MRAFLAVVKREFQSLFLNSIGYVFIASFAALNVLFALQIGQLIEAGRADLWSMFQFHPWLFMVLIPLLGMRAWSNEIRTHTLDTLLALPIPIIHLVLGKFLAGIFVILLALLSTFPLWITINLLGSVDNGATISAYIGSVFLAAGMLAIANAASSIASNQIIAFILATIFCFILSVLGLPIITQIISGVFGNSFADVIAGFSLTDQFESMARGRISLSGIIFFISTIIVWLTLAALFVDNKRSTIN